MLSKARIFLPDWLGSPTIAQSEAHARRGALIVHLIGEGQLPVDDALAGRLHELNADLERALEAVQRQPEPDEPPRRGEHLATAQARRLQDAGKELERVAILTTRMDQGLQIVFDARGGRGR
jgi:hypothetical protein